MKVQVNKVLTRNSGGHTLAVVLRDVIHVISRIDGVLVSQLEHLLEGIVDEDETDETSEAFLCEPGEVLNQEAGIRGHQNQAENRRPQTNPQPELQVVKVVISVMGLQNNAVMKMLSVS